MYTQRQEIMGQGGEIEYIIYTQRDRDGERKARDRRRNS